MNNDINLAAAGESFVRDTTGSLLYLSTSDGTGLGGGFVTEHGIFEGARSTALEAGHLIVDPDGPPCECGAYGCLQALVNAPAIASAMTSRALNGLMEHFAVALADLVNLLGPSEIVLGEALATFLSRDVSGLEAALNRRSFVAKQTRPALRPATVGLVESALLGAAEAAMEQFLADPLRAR